MWKMQQGRVRLIRCTLSKIEGIPSRCRHGQSDNLPQDKKSTSNLFKKLPSGLSPPTTALQIGHPGTNAVVHAVYILPLPKKNLRTIGQCHDFCQATVYHHSPLATCSFLTGPECDGPQQTRQLYMQCI
jgi:hypothetical protein